MDVKHIRDDIYNVDGEVVSLSGLKLFVISSSKQKLVDHYQAIIDELEKPAKGKRKTKSKDKEVNNDGEKTNQPEKEGNTTRPESGKEGGTSGA